MRLAIETVSPFGIDLCSGVEAVPGKKDSQKIVCLDGRHQGNIQQQEKAPVKAAVVHGKDDIRIESYPTPTAGEGELVVRTKVSGICATDIKTLLGQGLPKDLPTILGHEVVGEIAEVGAGVSTFTIGDRVAVYPIAVCGACEFCRQGRHNLCEHEFGLAHGIEGGFAEYVPAAKRNCQHRRRGSHP